MFEKKLEGDKGQVPVTPDYQHVKVSDNDSTTKRISVAL